MKNIKQIVGKNIRRLRIGSNLSQAELAERVGMSEVSVNRIENGKRGPSEESLEAFASALSVPVGELLPNMREGLSLPDKIGSLSLFQIIQELEFVMNSPLYPYLKTATNEQVALALKALSGSSLEKLRARKSKLPVALRPKAVRKKS